jgi:hypothetical protein
VIRIVSAVTVRALPFVALLLLCACSSDRATELETLGQDFEKEIAARADYVDHAPVRAEESARLEADWQKLLQLDSPGEVVAAVQARLPDATVSQGLEQGPRAEYVVSLETASAHAGETVAALYQALPHSFVQSIDGQAMQLKIRVLVLRASGLQERDKHQRKDVLHEVRYELERPPSGLPWLGEGGPHEHLKELLKRYQMLGQQLEKLGQKDADLRLAFERERGRKIDQLLAQYAADAAKAHDEQLSKLTAPWIQWVQLRFQKGEYHGRVGTTSGHTAADLRALLGSDVEVSGGKAGTFDVSFK